MDCETLLYEYAADYLMGELSEEGLSVFWEHINQCRSCRAIIFGVSIQDSLVTESFCQSGRSRLMSEVQSWCHRYDPLLESFASFLGCSLDLSKKFLCGCLSRADWVESEGSDIKIFETGFDHFHGKMSLHYVRLACGGRIDFHTHDGEERYFVLGGVCDDGSGEHYHKGDELIIPAGRSHALLSVGQEELLVAILSAGFSLLGN